MKKRLDVLMTEKNLAPSREKAQALIMSGSVYIQNQKSDKAGQLVDEDTEIEIRGEAIPFVSRGGLKLEKAIKCFPISLSDSVCMDIGASTGGFTDCMLQNGAQKVYAVDVGYGQLAWELRNDPRVVNLERTNIRYVTEEQISEPIDFFSVDVSFISLSLVLPVASRFLRENGEAVCLIKPQFEAGRGKVGKNGVVRDPEVHAEVIAKICALLPEFSLQALGLNYSPVKGPKGNIEYLLYVKKGAGESAVTDQIISDTVKASHAELDGGEKG